MPRRSLSQLLPDELNPLLDSLPPLLHIPIGTFGMRPIDKSDTAPQTQVAICDCRSQRLGSHGTTSPLAQSQRSLAQDQRPHPQFGLGDSQEP